jgi:hypothetical protein
VISAQDEIADYTADPHLNDDDFIRERLDVWLKHEAQTDGAGGPVRTVRPYSFSLSLAA